MTADELTRPISIQTREGEEYFCIRAIPQEGVFKSTGKGASVKADTLGEFRDEVERGDMVKSVRRGQEKRHMITEAHHELIMKVLDGYIETLGEDAEPEAFVERYK